MAARVSVDVVPATARPDAVSAALGEAVELRDRYRRSQEELAGVEAELRQLEAEDVAQAAARVRAGSPPGNVLASVTKAKNALDVSRRASAAIGLASDACQADLAVAITEHGADWIAACDAEQAEARTSGARAIAVLTESVERLRTAASTSAWIKGAISGGRYDRPARSMVVGSMAPSSRTVTANSEPLGAAAILGYAAELLGDETGAVGARGAGPDEVAASRAAAAAS